MVTVVTALSSMWACSTIVIRDWTRGDFVVMGVSLPIENDQFRPLLGSDRSSDIFVDEISPASFLPVPVRTFLWSFHYKAVLCFVKECDLRFKECDLRFNASEEKVLDIDGRQAREALGAAFVRNQTGSGAFFGRRRTFGEERG